MSEPILLGIRRKKTTEGGECEYERALRKPGEIVIADDMECCQLFGDTIFVAPQDSGLEGAHGYRFQLLLAEAMEQTFMRPWGVVR